MFGFHFFLSLNANVPKYILMYLALFNPIKFLSSDKYTKRILTVFPVTHNALTVFLFRSVSENILNTTAGLGNDACAVGHALHRVCLL